jgi:hypothetical protein
MYTKFIQDLWADLEGFVHVKNVFLLSLGAAPQFGLDFLVIL